MRGMPYKQASRRPASDVPDDSPEVREALARQAERRAPPTPARAMPVTPVLPRVAKNRRRRRTG